MLINCSLRNTVTQMSLEDFGLILGMRAWHLHVKQKLEPVLM